MNMDTLWAAKAEPIQDAEAERSLIAQAKAGSEAATLRLFSAYLPVLTKAVTSHLAAMDWNTSAGLDDARATAWVALMETIQKHDLERDRLALTIRFRLAETFKDAAGGHIPVNVHPRMRQRYFSAMAATEDDINQVANEYERFGFSSRAVVVAVHEAINGTVWFHGQGQTGDDEGDHSTGEDLLVDDTQDHYQVTQDRVVLAHTALRAVNDDKRAICRLYYGFDARDAEFTYNVDLAVELSAAMGSDANTAKMLGSTRPTVQRKRTAALVEMREVLTDE